jgi:hypothetical protein
MNNLSIAKLGSAISVRGGPMITFTRRTSLRTNGNRVSFPARLEN